MERDAQTQSGLTELQRPAIRFLVESALRKVVHSHENALPRTRDDWISRLCEALMSESETSHKAVISALMASGVSSEEIFQTFIPAAARYLGELWVSDRASFVDVTVGAGRLQGLFRASDSKGGGHWIDRSIPLGQSVLMVLPAFEGHSLGGFIAADHLRRHGVWVRMAIALDNWELAQLLESTRFAMVGISIATWGNIDNAAEIVDHLRTNVTDLPPIVIGGRVVDDAEAVLTRTGADYAVRSAREAIERCQLTTVATSLYASEGV